MTIDPDLTWRVALLSLVFVTDLVVFIDLCRQELGDLRIQRRAKPDRLSLVEGLAVPSGSRDNGAPRAAISMT